MTELAFGAVPSAAVRACIAAAMVFVYYALYTMVRCVTARKILLASYSALSLAGELVIFQAGTDILLKDPGRTVKVTSAILGSFPFHTVLLMTAAFALLNTFILITCIKKEKGEIGNNTVKEAVDMLPQGLCYYNDAGVPDLVNRVMTEISYALTGTAVLNAREFERAVFGDAPDGGNVIIKIDDKSYSFSRSVLRSKKKGILNVITATDVTEPVYYETELEKKNAGLVEINNRVRELGDKIVETTIQKEIFNNKVAIHNNLGELIVKTSAAVESGDYDREELLKLWRKDSGTFTDVSPEQEKDKYVVMNKVASDVGLKMKVRGKLPQEKKAKDVVICAMHQCIINTVCHAGGNELYIEVERTPDSVCVTFTNNGEVPKGEIKEGTGLSEVRSVTEAAGGKMTVHASPVFALVLEIPV